MANEENRAERRRREWTAQVVEAGTPKHELYASLTPAERVAALAKLNFRVFGEPSIGARSDWPAALFLLQPEDS